MKRALGLVWALSASSALGVTVGGHGLGLRHEPEAVRAFGKTHVVLDDCAGLPDDFDLRDLGVVPPVKNQGSCGSCWAFSKTASLESAYAAGSGTVLDLAEQELVSCDRSNYGCDGGLLNDQEYQVTKGEALEKDFPYTARDSSCKSGLKAAVKGTSFVQVGQSGRTATTKEVQCALFKSHTIPWITVSAGGGNWNSPPASDDGVFTSCRSGQTNHAVGVVGWKTIGGKVYFRMRNSWGDWGSTGGRPGGEKGYALLPLGCNSFGDEVAYVMTDAMPCKPPVVKLPIQVLVNAGDEPHLMVKAQQGVTYTWTVEGVAAGEGAMIDLPAVTKDTVVKVTAKNGCGQAESQTLVKVQADSVE
jgi:hypothetical protein